MATIQDTFAGVIGADATVVTDTTGLATVTAAANAAIAVAQKTLDGDTSADVSAHAGLSAAVVAQGPTLVTAVLADGTTEFIALLPQQDGTITNTVLFDGTKTPPPPVTTPAP